MQACREEWFENPQKHSPVVMKTHRELNIAFFFTFCLVDLLNFGLLGFFFWMILVPEALLGYL